MGGVKVGRSITGIPFTRDKGPRHLWWLLCIDSSEVVR